MYHKFYATPAKGRRQTERNIVSGSKKRKTRNACDRCRQQRIKCDEQKPCIACVRAEAQCKISHTPIVSSKANDKLSVDVSRGLPSNSPVEIIDAELQFVQLDASIDTRMHMQLPHATLPTGERQPVLNVLPQNQQSFYLRLYLDHIHPLLPIVHETELFKAETLSASGPVGDAILALAIQQSKVAGLEGRVLGFQQSEETSRMTWPGFGYFHRCRERMRANMEREATVEDLQCHAMMALYLMRGSAFRDAYNLLGITVRKAYVAKLHRSPPQQLPENEKMRRMFLWWTIFMIDVQCSLQLDMPAAIQKSISKCPQPEPSALLEHAFSPSRAGFGMSVSMYVTNMIRFAEVVAEIRDLASNLDLDDDDAVTPEALKHHVVNLTWALARLEDWHSNLPHHRLDLSHGDQGMTSPFSVHRQGFLLDLNYHNASTIIRRPFIRFCGSDKGYNKALTAGAFSHATAIVDKVYAACSNSDTFHGMPEVMQILWNATTTIASYAMANPLEPGVSRTPDYLTQAQAVFESFSNNSRTAILAVNAVRSFIRVFQETCSSDNSVDRDFPAALVVGQHLDQGGQSDLVFSPFMLSLTQFDTSDFSAMTMEFGD